MKPRAALLLTAIIATLATCGRQSEAPTPTSHEGHATGAKSSSGEPGITGMAEVEVPYERRQSMNVRTAEITRRSLVERLRTAGLVVADERRVRKVQTKISGWVEELFVSFTGAAVRAGAPILSIYSPELVATQREYLLALEASRQGTTDVAAARDSRLLLDSARNRLRYWDITDAQIDALGRSGEPRRSVVLHSPISGYVTLKPVYQGMYVTPEMELYQVTDLDSVWVWGEIYEDEIGLVAAGQRATITLRSAPDREREAVVSYVQPTVEPATRTLRARFDVDNRDGALKPGMYATIELEVPLGEVLALPEDAVIDTGERRVVFVEVAQGRFQPREVRLGRRSQGHFEILDGLSAGERVVVSAQFLLDSESRLRAAAAGPAHGSH